MQLLGQLLLPSSNRTDCNEDDDDNWVPSRERAWEDAVKTLKGELSNGRYNLGVARFSGGSSNVNDSSCTSQPSSSLTMVSGSGSTFANNFENAAQISPSGSTPTPAALLGTLDPNRDGTFTDARYLLGGDTQSAVRAKAVVLVTDGLPTRCPGNGTATGDTEMNAAVEAARRIAANGTQVFVLGFDIGEDARFQQLANAGDPTKKLCSGSATSQLPCVCNGGSNSPSGCAASGSLTPTRWYVVSDTSVDHHRGALYRSLDCQLHLGADNKRQCRRHDRSRSLCDVEHATRC